MVNLTFLIEKRKDLKSIIFLKLKKINEFQNLKMLFSYTVPQVGYP